MKTKTTLKSRRLSITDTPQVDLTEGLQLEVDWRGYPRQKSWIPLESCDGCVKLVNAYFRKNKLEKPNLMH